MSSPRWRKSSLSPTGTQCVEVALNVGATSALVRDSKNAEGEVLKFSKRSFDFFLASV